MAAKTEDASDKLRRLRKSSDFAPVWLDHSETRMRQYGFDRVSVARVIRSGSIGLPERDVQGREQVHVSGTIDGERVDVVVEPTTAEDGTEVVRVVTVKPKNRRT